VLHHFFLAGGFVLEHQVSEHRHFPDVVQLTQVVVEWASQGWIDHDPRICVECRDRRVLELAQVEVFLLEHVDVGGVADDPDLTVVDELRVLRCVFELHVDGHDLDVGLVIHPLLGGVAEHIEHTHVRETTHRIDGLSVGLIKHSDLGVQVGYEFSHLESRYHDAEQTAAQHYRAAHIGHGHSNGSTPESRHDSLLTHVS